jgi:hypothetical protein
VSKAATAAIRLIAAANALADIGQAHLEAVAKAKDEIKEAALAITKIKNKEARLKAVRQFMDGQGSQET